MINLTLNPNGDGNYVLYYTNASGDATWENLANWNTAADGSGDNPTEVPWSDTDGSTSGSDLIDASGGAGVSINSNIDPNQVVSGSCDIPSINNGGINGGTFSGDNFTNNALIGGGTFSGYGFINNDGIYGGTFTGDNFTNNGLIYGGTFSGYGFTNYNFIYGGTFSGYGFINTNNGLIGGGTFSGDNFTNNSTFTGIYAEHYYTNGVLDASINGLYFDSYYYPGGYEIFSNGVSNGFFNGGWMGVHYFNGYVDTAYIGIDYDFYYGEDFLYVYGSAITWVVGWNGVLYNPGGGIDSQDTGWFTDYGYDPSGNTQYFFVNRYVFNGGWNGQHYTNGIADNFTGIDYDFFYGEDILYVGGGCASGGWGQYHYSPGIDSFTGYDYDFYYGEDFLYVDGSAITWVGGWNGVLYNPGGGYDLISGLFPDYYIDSTGQTLSYFSYGNSDGTAVYINYPDPSDVRSGVSYGLTVPQKVGTLSISNGGGGSSSGINLGQLIGLPSFIQL